MAWQPILPDNGKEKLLGFGLRRRDRLMLLTLASNVVVAQVWQEPALHVMLRDARVGWHGRQPWQEPAQLMSMARVGWHGRPALAKTSATDAPDARA